MVVEIHWQFKHSWNFSNQHHTTLRDEALGVQCEVITKKKDGGYGTGKAKSYYFIDNDEREFLSEEELIEAYNEKFKLSGESPDTEVSYIRVEKKVKDGTVKNVSLGQFFQRYSGESLTLDQLTRIKAIIEENH